MDDSGHRPWADFKGEIPRNVIARAPYNLQVTLDQWGPWSPAVMAEYLQANWGDAPAQISPEEAGPYVRTAFAGKTLQQVLEGISFWFTVNGVTRACTHQLVRTRFAAVMQHGGRDNDWRHRAWVLPEALRRLIRSFDSGQEELELKSCLRDSTPLHELLRKYRYHGMYDLLRDHLQQARDIYAALVDAGAPWQDARRILKIGMETYIHLVYNFVSLKGFLANRLEHIMDWEINCVAQLMLRQIKMHCPSEISDNLKSHSDFLRRAAFAALDSWPPDQKYPASYDPKKRKHTALQMPFFILHPDSMAGGPVNWIPTNGVYPEELRPCENENSQ